MEVLDKYYNMFEKVKFIGVIISGISILAMMFIIVVDIFSRSITGGSILGVFEITQNYIMILTIFPVLPYLYSSGVMPRMDLLAEKMSNKTGGKMTILLIIFEMVIYTFVLIYSFEYAYTGFLKDSHFFGGGKLYPIYPVQFLIPVAFLFLVIENIFIILKSYLTKKPMLVYKKYEEEYF